MSFLPECPACHAIGRPHATWCKLNAAREETDRMRKAMGGALAEALKERDAATADRDRLLSSLAEGKRYHGHALDVIKAERDRAGKAEDRAVAAEVEVRRLLSSLRTPSDALVESVAASIASSYHALHNFRDQARAAIGAVAELLGKGAP